MAQWAGMVLQTKRSLVRFLARAQAWVVGSVPGWGCARGSPLMFLSHVDVSLPLFLSPCLPLSLKIKSQKKRKAFIGVSTDDHKTVLTFISISCEQNAVLSTVS